MQPHAIACTVQAWESYFRKRIMGIRAKELSILWKSFKLSALNTLILQTVRCFTRQS